MISLILRRVEGTLLYKKVTKMIPSYITEYVIKQSQTSSTFSYAQPDLRLDDSYRILDPDLQEPVSLSAIYYYFRSLA